MEAPHCVLCDILVVEGGIEYPVTPEAIACDAITPGAPDVEAFLTQNVLCERCAALTPEVRQKRAYATLTRVLGHPLSAAQRRAAE
ncbi:MAG: hypothetical protein ABI629_21835 [bacterium]